MGEDGYPTDEELEPEAREWCKLMGEDPDYDGVRDEYVSHHRQKLWIFRAHYLRVGMMQSDMIDRFKKRTKGETS